MQAMDQAAYRDILRERGLSVTRLRLAIMDVLHRGEHAATASHVLEQLRERHSVHKTTVYRNLAALEEADLVRRVPSGGRSFIYELSCPHRLPVHPHFTCRSCGEVVCLQPVDLSSVWGEVAPGREVTVEEVQVTVTGLCADCRPGDGGAAE